MVEPNYSNSKKEISKEEGEKPSKFIPTKKMFFAFLIVFIVGTFMNLSHFPISQFMSMSNLDKGIIFNLGWPQTFTAFDLLNSKTTPINWINFIANFAIYLLVAYFIDVLFTFFIDSDFYKNIFGNKKEITEKPKLIG